MQMISQLLNSCTLPCKSVKNVIFGASRQLLTCPSAPCPSLPSVFLVPLAAYISLFAVLTVSSSVFVCCAHMCTGGSSGEFHEPEQKRYSTNRGTMERFLSERARARPETSPFPSSESNVPLRLIFQMMFCWSCRRS